MRKEKTLQEHFVVIENLFFIGFAVMLISGFFKNNALFWILFAVGLLLIVAAGLYNNKHFKCPHCGSKMNGIRGVPKHCPDCGNKLQ